MIIIIG